MTRAGSLLVPLLLLSASSARATECGELKLQATYLKAAVGAEETLRNASKVKELTAALKSLERRVASACAPKRVGISALPLGYLPVPPGNSSRVTFDPGESWQLVMTAHGLRGGLTLGEPALVQLPAGMHWEVDGKVGKAGDIMIAVATNAQLVIEETSLGKGSWRVEVRGQPTLVSLAQIRGCAEGSSIAGLSPAACAVLARIDPLGGGGALPERGRALLVGEWQYGGPIAIDLGDEELTGMVTGGPPPRLDMPLELTSPIDGITEGRQLMVTFEGNRQNAGGGAGFRLANDCGDDAACAKQRFAVEIWYDRIFGVPFIRTPPRVPYSASIVGRIANRLERPIGGQRMMATAGGRSAITLTDRDGSYRFDGLFPGEVSIFPVARKLGEKPRADQTRTLTAGAAETKATVLYIDRFFE